MDQPAVSQREHVICWSGLQTVWGCKLMQSAVHGRGLMHVMTEQWLGGPDSDLVYVRHWVEPPCRGRVFDLTHARREKFLWNIIDVHLRHRMLSCFTLVGVFHEFICG